MGTSNAIHTTNEDTIIPPHNTHTRTPTPTTHAPMNRFRNAISYAVPYEEMRDAGCNLWRNWQDIETSWASIKRIIMYWWVSWLLFVGGYAAATFRFRPPGT
jgi:hypothetical protein